MTQQTGNSLRESIDKIARARHRVTWVMSGLILLMLAHWVAIVLARDDRQRMVYGLGAVILGVFAAALATMRISNRNTLEILKAVESLAQQNQKG